MATEGPVVSMSGLIATIDRRPQAALAAFLGLHVIVWTALPALLYPNLPLDLIEALTYGREWQLGYDKLPPLPWWLVEAIYRLIGLDAAYYALAQVAVAGAFVAVWAVAFPLVGPCGALVALLIIDGLHYFHYTAAKFNHDVIQLPLWALAGYAYWAAMRGGRMIHWVMLGLALGLALGFAWGSLIRAGLTYQTSAIPGSAARAERGKSRVARLRGCTRTGLELVSGERELLSQRPARTGLGPLVGEVLLHTGGLVGGKDDVTAPRLALAHLPCRKRDEDVV